MNKTGMETLRETWLFIANSEASNECIIGKVHLNPLATSGSSFHPSKDTRRNGSVIFNPSAASSAGDSMTCNMLMRSAVSVYVAVRIYELCVCVCHPGLTQKRHICMRARY